MEKSEKIDELVLALSRAQGEFRAVPFNSVNPFLKNRYADLGAVIESVKEILSNHGLSVMQLVTSDNGNVGVTTMLAHASGQWISEKVYLPMSEEKGKSLAQVAGSVVTYLRRYALSAILGLYADEDTDGSEPERKPQPKPEQKKPVAQKPEPQKTPEPQSKPTPQEDVAGMITIWDGKTQKPSNELVDQESALKFVRINVNGKGKPFEVNEYFFNHAKAHFDIDRLDSESAAKVVTKFNWAQMNALVKHIKNLGDEPEWYPAKYGKKAEPEHEDNAGVNLDELSNKWKNAPSYESLALDEKERISDMLALVRSGAIANDDYEGMAGVLDA